MEPRVQLLYEQGNFFDVSRRYPQRITACMRGVCLNLPEVLDRYQESSGQFMCGNFV